MAGEWRIKQFDQILAEPVRNGLYKTKEFHGRGMKIVNMGELFAYPRLRAIPMNRVELNDSEIDRFCLSPGDLLFARRSLVAEGAGKCSIVLEVDEPTAFESSIIRARPDQSNTNSLFLYYFFNSPVGLYRLDTIRRQVAVAGITGSDLSKLELTLPPLPEQRAIAHILGTVDDKIELNRRMNETLEGIARALFNSWFIDFDPVRRNMARRLGQNQPSPPPPLPSGEEREHYRAGYEFAGLVEIARGLRKKLTSAEAIFWEMVRDRRFLGLKFRRQHQIGDYIVDFYCNEQRLVVEFDGGVHHDKQQKDHKRDAWMAAQGFKVLRFPNEQLLEAPGEVLQTIAEAAGHSPADSPFGSRHLAGLSPDGRRVGDEGVVEGAAFDHLFPDRFQDSELGEIPEGWDGVALPEMIVINPTRSLRKGGIAPYLEMANMPTQGHSPSEIIARPFGSGMRFVNGDTLVARITPCLENGKTAFVDFLQDGQVGWGSTEYIVLRSKPPLPPEFAYCLARSPAFREFAIQSMTGTSGRQRVQAESFKHFMLPRVPMKIAEVFGLVVTSLFERSSKAVNESRILAALRDTLLPKLISGEIRIKDAERFIGRCL